MTFPALVPCPESVEVFDGDTTVPDVVPVEADPPMTAWQRRSLEDWLGSPVQPVGPDAEKAWVVIGHDDALAEGAYRLVIDGGIRISAAGTPGVINALQTLRQFTGPDSFSPAPARRSSPLTLPNLEIVDRPRFGFRGVHLDVARHFVPKREVLTFIDVAAAHKLNALHLHLTDDQGWRVPIEKYPDLTVVGAYRDDSLVATGPDGTKHFAGRPHGGFYTKGDIREIVEFAASRGVTVIPEIDVPGHSVAAIAAYPELGVDSPDVDVWTEWGINDCVLDPSQSTVDFYTGVLDEVMDMFDSPVIHIGGDEVPYARWQNSPTVRERAAALGLGSVADLHGWFLARLVEHIESRGRRAGVWHEAVSAALPTSAVVNAWDDVDGVRNYLCAGYDTVVSCCSHLYFDYRPSDEPDSPSPAVPVISLQDVYGFAPDTPDVRDAAAQAGSSVVGMQAQLWTEWLDTPSARNYHAYPRLAAFAEVSWSTERDYEDFIIRLENPDGGHLARLDAAGIDYRPLSGPRPDQHRPDVARMTGR